MTQTERQQIEARKRALVEAGLRPDRAALIAAAQQGGRLIIVKG